MLLLIPTDITVLPRRHFSSGARVMVMPLFDHPWSHHKSRESRDHLYDAQLTYRIHKFLLPRTMHLFIATAHVVRDTADATDRGTWITMGILFAFLCASPSVQVRVVAGPTNGVSREAKNNMVMHMLSILGRHNMNTLSALLVLCEENHWPPTGFPSQTTSQAELWLFCEPK